MSIESVTKNRIADLLQEEGITAYRLAKRIGRKPHVVTRIIDGTRNASDKLKADISAGLGRDVDEVFTLGETFSNHRKNKSL